MKAFYYFSFWTFLILELFFNYKATFLTIGLRQPERQTDKYTIHTHNKPFFGYKTMFFKNSQDRPTH